MSADGWLEGDLGTGQDGPRVRTPGWRAPAARAWRRPRREARFRRRRRRVPCSRVRRPVICLLSLLLACLSPRAGLSGQAAPEEPPAETPVERSADGLLQAGFWQVRPAPHGRALTARPVAGLRAAPDGRVPGPLAPPTEEPRHDRASLPSASRDVALAGLFVGSYAVARTREGWDARLSASARRHGGGVAGTVGAAGDVAGNGMMELGAAAGAYLTGRLAGQETLARTALRSVEAILAVDVLATTLKAALGRMRPSLGEDPGVYRPGSLDSGYFSFPSGHTAHAFALAATVSRELPGTRWLPYALYPLAGAVGVSRVVHGRHWPTDVMAGVAVGLFASRWTGRLHGERTRRADGPRPLVLASASGHMVLGVSVPFR